MEFNINKSEMDKYLKEVNSKLGKRLKQKRKEKELTLAKLGDMVGVTNAYLSRVENGFEFPSLYTIAALAYVLHVSTSWLLGEDTEININNISEDHIGYEKLLEKHKFPNGLTYIEMAKKVQELDNIEGRLARLEELEEKEKKLEKLQKILGE